MSRRRCDVCRSPTEVCVLTAEIRRTMRDDLAGWIRILCRGCIQRFQRRLDSDSM